MSVIRHSAISAVNDPAQSSFSSSEVIAGKSVSRGLRTFTALKRFTEIDANILVKITPPPSPLIVIPSISSKM
jgi:hypothetical protein